MKAGKAKKVNIKPNTLGAVDRITFQDTGRSVLLLAEGRLVKSTGYAATPLTGVWANYPYLHNGSVPSLHHLLGPVSERPTIFNVLAARDFDRERVGQRLVVGDDRNRASREWFDTERPGSGNGGHDFWSRIRTDANRRALIEYLKTL